MNPRALLTLHEAATHLNKSRSWLYRNRKSLGIRSFKIGGTWHFSIEDLDNYIWANAQGGLEAGPITKAMGKPEKVRL